MYEFKFREENLFIKDRIKIRDDLFLRNPKVIDIFDLGEDWFNWFLDLFTSHPHQKADLLDDIGKDFQDFKNDYEFFIYNFSSRYPFNKDDFNNEHKSNFDKLFKYFFDMKNIRIMVRKNNGKDEYFLKDEDDKQIDLKTYFDISHIIRSMASIPIDKCPRFRNKIAKEWYIKSQARKRRKAMSKENETKSQTRNMVSKIVVSQKCTYEYVYNLYYAQFKDIIKETTKIYEYMAVNNAIYNNCDLTKIKMEKYHWLS